MGGMPPVNFSQRVAATRQIRQQQQDTIQFSAFLYIAIHCSLTIHLSFESHGEGPANAKLKMSPKKFRSQMQSTVSIVILPLMPFSFPTIMEVRKTNVNLRSQTGPPKNDEILWAFRKSNDLTSFSFISFVFVVKCCQIVSSYAFMCRTTQALRFVLSTLQIFEFRLVLQC